MNPSIFVALDFSNQKYALDFLDDNHLTQVPVKVGMQLFYREGTPLIEQLKKRGHPIFLDLKLHDIPHTVYSAMKSLAELEVDMVNVHAAGGRQMMIAARKGLEDGSKQRRPLLLAVTQLTSTDETMLNEELLIKRSVTDVATSYALNAKGSGVDGVVCSVHESEMIKNKCGIDFLTVTPGIRLIGDSNDDQKRVATPQDAKFSDHLVIGRSVTNSSNPKNAYEQAMKEWGNEFSQIIN